jgi:5'-nucleotidase
MSYSEEVSDHIALIDLDGTVADYDKAMAEWQERLRAPDEKPIYYRMDHEHPHIEARRKLVQNLPGFWESLPRLTLGFEVIEEMRSIGFSLHVLTKGPTSCANAWGEKLKWSQRHLPDAAVTVSGDKSLVYGRVLFDDFPPYYTAWLRVRPRGLVVCLAHPWNEGWAPGGPAEHPQVLRYDGSPVSLLSLRAALANAFDRKSGARIAEATTTEFLNDA